MTLCEYCGEEESTTHTVEIIDGKKHVEHLCKDCAEQIASYSAQESVPTEQAEATQEAILHFQKTGKFGHPDDYDLLRKEIEVFLKKIHGSSQHCGKVPQSHNSKQQIQELTVLMDEAASHERFEDAAKLRDKIRKLQ